MVYKVIVNRFGELLGVFEPKPNVGFFFNHEFDLQKLIQQNEGQRTLLKLHVPRDESRDCALDLLQEIISGQSEQLAVDVSLEVGLFALEYGK